MRSNFEVTRSLQSSPCTGQDGIAPRQQHALTPAVPRKRSTTLKHSKTGHRHSLRGRSTRTPTTASASSYEVDLSSWSDAGGTRGPSTRSTAQDFQLNGCFVSGARGRPQGVVHFCGGAFAGATPQLTVLPLSSRSVTLLQKLMMMIRRHPMARHSRPTFP